MNWLGHSGRPIISTAVAALTGATFTLLVLLIQPNPLLDWMRVITIESEPMPPLREILVAFGVLTGVAAVGVALARWFLRRLSISGAGATFATVMALAFCVAFAGETVSQVVGAWGNLTASDAAGPLFEDGRLTPHGWSTIARRASFAAMAAGLMAISFQLASAALNTARSRQ